MEPRVWFDQAAISKLGSTAEEAFDGAGTAAKKFGASIGQLKAVDQVIAELRQKSRESGVAFATLAQNYDIARASAARAGSGFGQVANGAGAATTAVGSLRQELRALAQIAQVAGIGAFGGLASAIAGTVTQFGAAAAAVGGLVVVGGTLTKFALDAVKVAEGLSRLSEVSGVAFGTLSELQGAFQLSGVSAEQFSQQLIKLAADYENHSEAAKKANLAVRESHLALAQAQQQGMQIAQQFADLQLQSAQRAQQAKQLQMQVAAIKTQLSYLPQINALESLNALISPSELPNPSLKC